MKVIGAVLVAAGIAVGLWAGLWWALIGGIVEVIDAVKATPTDAYGIAFGCVRVMFSAVIGFASGAIAVLPGLAMLND